MTVPCHPLFSPLGTLRIKTPAYYRIHAKLRRDVERMKRYRTRSEKQITHENHSRKFKAQADTDA